MPSTQPKQAGAQDPMDFNNNRELRAQLFILRNKSCCEITISDYGARIVSLVVPDKNRQLTNVVLGFDHPQEYLLATMPYYGAAIGRYGNRIAGGKFSLGGQDYQLPQNNGGNCLHGGLRGFHDHVWEAAQRAENCIEFSRMFEDGDEGFPGNLRVKILYTLTENSALRIQYEAVSDKSTIINLTNHAFFNLNGAGMGDIYDHDLHINADAYTPVDGSLIPTGALEPVEGTPFDFRQSVKIGLRINQQDEQLAMGNGYDHNYVLNPALPAMKEPAAIAIGDLTGIRLKVFTTEPGLQFYSGNFMDGTNRISGGIADHFRTAFCLETQHFPDSPNQPAFPPVVLKPQEIFYSETIYAFDLA
ncbi:MAG: aldose epimerase [Ferruginibacter sp.]|nr:aldose epimerase [Ferruginibacter sp.]